MSYSDQITNLWNKIACEQAHKWRRVRKKIAERGLGRETKRWESLYIDFALMLLINPLAIIIL